MDVVRGPPGGDGPFEIGDFLIVQAWGIGWVGSGEIVVVVEGSGGRRVGVGDFLGELIGGAVVDPDGEEIRKLGVGTS